MSFIKSTDGMNLFRSSDEKVVKTLLIITVFPCILGVSVALFAPQNILQLLPFLQSGVDIMTTQFPFMAVRIARSTIPQVLAVTYLIGWFFLPMQMILLPYCCFRYANAAVFYERWRSQGQKNIWQFRLMSYCLLYVMAFGITLNGDYNYLGIDPVHTRFGLAWIVGLGFTFWSGLWTYALILTFMINSNGGK